MKALITDIANNILPSNVENNDIKKLQQLVNQYPYAPDLQLLLAYALKDTDNNIFEKQYQKTLLYYNNPLQIQYLILHKEDKEVLNPSHEIKATNIASIAIEPEIKMPSLKTESIKPEKAELLFTPYHTVDYFASQGIKLGGDIKTTDKFGEQLKSFTDWLKEMRLLPEANANIQLNKVSENVVEKMAAFSLTGDNANTIAMAEVWTKQGNRQKAIDVYQKLSLQNPAKSAYFAAKIEHLKKMS